MPGPTRTQRAEAKYNVTTDYPYLGLHQAAATGDIGLMKYAISHGQPVNSVLDGVLPLHVACSAGDEFVVKYLIEHGADVNAPRLPRRYSNDKNRATPQQPIIGTSGSTPLHFASANGHANIAATLLQHGAHPDRPDKHGITPEMLARDGGYANTAELLRSWSCNRDRDLRERGYAYGEEGGRERQGSVDGDGSMRRRLNMKRSVEFALSTLKGSSLHAHSQSASSTAPLTSRDRSPSTSRTQPQPLGEYTFYPAPSTDPSRPPNLSERRPSLPQIYDTMPSAPRKSSSSSRPSSRRPQSAGNGAEPSPRRRLGSKYSLLNLFKKANPDESSSPPSESSSPPLAPLTTSPLPTATSFSDKSPSPVEGPSHSGRFRARYGSEGTASSRMPVHVASAFDFDVGSARSRTRSGSGASSRKNEGQEQQREGSTPPSRPGPGILKGHMRNVSGSSGQDSGGRSLRFDSNASMALRGARTESPRTPADTNLSMYVGENVISLDSPPQVVEQIEGSGSEQGHRRAGDEEEEEEEEYGEVIRSGLGFAPSPKAALLEISTRRVGALSPILSAQDVSASPTDATHFPFSLDRPLQRPGGLSADNRLRGDSVSSMATDASAPSSGGVTTPAIGEHALPPAVVAAINLDEDFDPPEVYAGSALLLEDAEVGFAAGAKRVPLGIDIGLISSHAQAEALVRAAQKEILETEHGGGDEEVPLSAKLAAYGESLAIERRFKEEREKAERERQREWEGGRGQGHARRPSAGARSSSRGAAQTNTPPRVKKIRRPHTAGGESGSRYPGGQMGLGHARHAQGMMRSTSVHVSGHSPITQASEFPYSTNIEIVETAATPVEGSPVRVAPPFERVRSRTPDPEGERYSLDEQALGVPLSRVSTAPCEDAVLGRGARSRNVARHVASANKLTRMGFVATDGYQTPSGYSTPGAGNKNKFGGLKSFVQSLKGRA